MHASCSFRMTYESLGARVTRCVLYTSTINLGVLCERYMNFYRGHHAVRRETLHRSQNSYDSRLKLATTEIMYCQKFRVTENLFISIF